jgi:hypothetical protein
MPAHPPGGQAGPDDPDPEVAMAATVGEELLASWNGGAALAAIRDFVAR